jgi:hypothetical protein
VTAEFYFGDYTVRSVTPDDAAQIQRAIEGDPFHDGRKSETFLQSCPGEDNWALEDAQGKVVFYFKTKTACRVSIQFVASETAEDRQRNRDGMAQGLKWLEARLVQNQFRELIINTENRLLRFFAAGRLGFRRYRDEMVRPLAPPEVKK